MAFRYWPSANGFSGSPIKRAVTQHLVSDIQGEPRGPAKMSGRKLNAVEQKIHQAALANNDKVKILALMSGTAQAENNDYHRRCQIKNLPRSCQTRQSARLL
jgi:hypothetical protein